MTTPDATDPVRAYHEALSTIVALTRDPNCLYHGAFPDLYTRLMHHLNVTGHDYGEAYIRVIAEVAEGVLVEHSRTMTDELHPDYVKAITIAKQGGGGLKMQEGGWWTALDAVPIAGGNMWGVEGVHWVHGRVVHGLIDNYLVMVTKCKGPRPIEITLVDVAPTPGRSSTTRRF